MFPRVAGPRRLAGMTLLVFGAWTVALWIFLPPDNPFVLFLQFTTSRFASVFRSPTDDERLLLERPGRFPFTDDEVAYIVKTGYGTQERVPALLEATRAIGAGSKYDEDNILVVADFTGELEIMGRPVVVHDMVEAVMKHDAIVKTPLENTARMQKYGNMTLAITEGRTEEATQYSKAVGWELDALKVGSFSLLLPARLSLLTDCLVHAESRTCMGNTARQEMVRHAGRRYLHTAAVTVPVPRTP